MISTMPLDQITEITDEAENLRDTSRKLVYSSTHVIGVGIRGVLPPRIGDKCWLYLYCLPFALFFANFELTFSSFSIAPRMIAPSTVLLSSPTTLLTTALKRMSRSRRFKPPILPSLPQSTLLPLVPVLTGRSCSKSLNRPRSLSTRPTSSLNRFRE